MRKFKKSLTVLLTLVMALALVFAMSIAASAEEDPQPPQPTFDNSFVYADYNGVWITTDSEYYNNYEYFLVPEGTEVADVDWVKPEHVHNEYESGYTEDYYFVEFTNVSPLTSYDVYARIAGTEVIDPSDAIYVTVTTQNIYCFYDEDTGMSLYAAGMEGYEYILVQKGATINEDSWANAVTAGEVELTETYPGEEPYTYPMYVASFAVEPLTEYDVYYRLAADGETPAGEANKIYAGISPYQYYDTWLFGDDLVGGTVFVDIYSANEESVSVYWFYTEEIPNENGEGTHDKITPIDGAKGLTYELKDEDLGKTLLAKVYYDDDDYYDKYLGQGKSVPIEKTGTIDFFDDEDWWFDDSEPFATQTDLAYGDKITKPEKDPEKEGYEFGGWLYNNYYKDGKEVDVFWDFEKDTVKYSYDYVYAKWKNAVKASFADDQDIYKQEGISKDEYYISLDVKDASKSVSDKDKELVAGVLGENTVAFYLDINLILIDLDTYYEELITETKGKVKIAITIPEELRKEGREFAVIRVHDGKAEIINGTYDAETGKFTFESDKFSTYAIIYADEVVAKTDGSVIETANYMPVVLAMIFFCAAFITTNEIMDRKQRVK